VLRIYLSTDKDYEAEPPNARDTFVGFNEGQTEKETKWLVLAAFPSISMHQARQLEKCVTMCALTGLQ